MRKHFLFAAAAICMAFFGLTSCNDDDPTPPAPTPTPTPGDTTDTDPDSNANDMDLTTINFMKHGWVLTQIECEEISADLLTEYQAAMFRNDGSLYMDPYGDPNASDYHNWDLNIVLNNKSDFNFGVDEYKVENGRRWLSITTNEDGYEGVIEMTQDDEKVYVQYSGQSYRGGKPTVFKGYKLKSRF